MTRDPIRLQRILDEKEHDTYRIKGKLAEPTVCPNCHAVYHKGHWQWLDIPDGADKHKCPACLRIEDNVPCGYVSISGAFYKQHKEEIMGLIRSKENREKTGHPLNRIMNISETADGLEITTTDMHLPRDIGVALEHAYDGELDYHYESESNILRVKWSR